MSTQSLSATDALGANNAMAPRVSVKNIEDQMESVIYINLGDAIERTNQSASASSFLMTLCVITMRNGFVEVGKSAPASPENFDREKGKVFAYEDAVRNLWPKLGYALRDALYMEDVLFESAE
jgi:hypothetical protein